MSDEKMVEEFPDEETRRAVCEDQWQGENNMNRNVQNFSPFRRERRDGYEVRNQGGEIEASKQAKIFERFYRATNSRQQQGLGLGLNIARTLARIQQGELELLSSSAEATVFQLRLPRAETDCSNGSGKGQ